ncbi:MAG: hypothetical protein J6S13_07995 [Clostridia bacterium]|nr:hypothetical protein [Clostridia bacterium]
MILCGCSNNEVYNISPVTSNFKCDFVIQNSKEHGELTVSESGDVTFLFQSDDSVNGLSITVKRDNIIIDVHGITEKYSRDELPDDSPILIFYESLLNASNSSPKLKGDEIIVSGETPNGTYTLLLDSSGFITQIEFDSISTKINFSNHHLNNT